ncbi:hypothetical protein IGI57_000248 [Enterococcus sp. DIV0213j]
MFQKASGCCELAHALKRSTFQESLTEMSRGSVKCLSDTFLRINWVVPRFFVPWLFLPRDFFIAVLYKFYK